MPSSVPPGDLWNLVRADLRGSFPEDLFQMWFDGLQLIEANGSSFVLGAPNEMTEVWVAENYLEAITQRFCEHLGIAVDVRIRDIATSGPAVDPSRPSPTEPEADPARPSRRAKADTGSPFAGSLNPKCTFETFIVGANNEIAHACAMSVARSPAQAYNPLLIYGQSGLGKTHLMHAIGHYVLQSRPETKIAYLTSEKFTNDFIVAIGEVSLPKFRQRYRGVDILLIDDVHFFCNKERAQEEFFHTFNDLTGSGKQIVLTCDRPLQELNNLEKRLLSRFGWGMTVDIKSPDFETRVAILRRKAKVLGFDIPDETINFIAEKIVSNIRQLEGAVIRVGSSARVSGRRIDRQAAEEMLRDFLFEEAKHQLTIEQIQKRVCEHFSLRPIDMTSRRRPNNIAQPRQIAMYLARCLTPHSLEEIGEHFGGRDHGTVIHAVKTVENLCAQNASIRSTVEYLKRELSR